MDCFILRAVSTFPCWGPILGIYILGAFFTALLATKFKHDDLYAESALVGLWPIAGIIFVWTPFLIMAAYWICGKKWPSHYKSHELSDRQRLVSEAFKAKSADYRDAILAGDIGRVYDNWLKNECPPTWEIILAIEHLNSRIDALQPPPQPGST